MVEEFNGNAEDGDINREEITSDLIPGVEP